MQTKKRSDFIVGIVSLLAIIVLILGVLWLKGEAFTQHRNSYTASFPQVGGLQIGDPVMVNGIRYGTVSDIFLSQNHVNVIFSILDTLSLYDQSSVTIMEMGLLGEKKIEIFYRTTGNKIAPNSSKTTPYIFDGIYQSGITETIGSVHLLTTKLIDVIDVMDEGVGNLASSLSDSGSFMPFLDTMMARLDTITRVTQSIVTTNDSKINQIVTNLQVASQQTRALLDTNSSTITTVVNRSDSISLQMQHLLERLSTVVAEIDSGDGLVTKLLTDEAFAGQIDSTLQTFNALMDDMMGSGVKVRVRLGHRERKNDTSNTDKKE